MSEEQGTASDGMAVAAEVPEVADSKSTIDNVHGALSDIMDGLSAEYEHPHHRGRLEQIASHVKMLHGLVDELPLAEANRQHRAGELLEMYRKRTLPLTVAHHDEELLDQELARMGEK